MRPPGRVVASLVAAALLTACGSDADVGEAETPATAATAVTTAATESVDERTVDSLPELYPEVVAIDASQDADGTWTFRVTLSSPYDTPDRYADAWRVESPDGEVLAIRELAHDHQNEQPFTRATSGVAIPEELRQVVVRGRDQVSGWSPDAVEFELPG